MPKDIEHILTAWENFGPIEKELVHEFVCRLWAGQDAYGKIKINKKNWTREAIEEAIDQAVYLLALLKEHDD